MPATATTPLLDPTKRVHYTLGLVLGEDEFRQEQGYFIERDRLHNRALHGYGTVSGLAVRVVPAGDGDAEVQVAPGLAVDPHGESIAIDVTQCARLAPWLSRRATRDRLDAGPGSPPDRVRVYLTLAYAERLTDDVPVPGAPCRDEDDSAVASRIDDAFELAFSLDRPPHVEDAAVRRFADFLGRITLVADDSADAGEALTEAEFLDAVRAYAATLPPASPPDSPPASPPDAPPVLLLTSEADSLLRAGLRVWVTELRPDLLGDAYANPREAGDDRVLLAELAVGIERDGETVRVAMLDDGPDVTLVEDDRPYLLSTRLLQERLLARFDVRFEETLGIGDAAGGDLAGTYPSPTVRGLQTRAVADAAPANGNVLTWNAGADRWEPRAVASGGGGIEIRDVAERLPTIPLVTVVPNTDDRDRGPGFFLWFHLDANPDLQRDNVPVVEELGDEAVRVFAETDRDTPAANPFLRRLDADQPDGSGLPRNTFFLPVEEAEDATQLRFKVDLEQIGASADGRSFRLIEWVAERPMKWEGHDGERTVTVFVVNDRSEPRPEPEPQPQPRTGPDIVAAGVFEQDRNGRLRARGPVVGDLQADPLPNEPGDVLLRFRDFRQDGTYVVTGTPLVQRDQQRASNTFQVVLPVEDRGIRVRFRSLQGEPQITGFMAQVVQITG